MNCCKLIIALFLGILIGNIFASDYDYLIKRYSNKYSLDPLFVKAIIKVESDFRVKAVSEKGAIGLMQIMPNTAKMYNYTEKDMFNPEKNIDCGTRYLRDIIDLARKFGYNGMSLFEQVLQAYYAGPKNLENREIGRVSVEYVKKVDNQYKKYGGKYKWIWGDKIVNEAAPWVTETQMERTFKTKKEMYDYIKENHGFDIKDIKTFFENEGKDKTEEENGDGSNIKIYENTGGNNEK